MLNLLINKLKKKLSGYTTDLTVIIHHGKMGTAFARKFAGFLFYFPNGAHLIRLLNVKFTVLRYSRTFKSTSIFYVL